MDEVATTAVRYARDSQPELPPEVTVLGLGHPQRCTATSPAAAADRSQVEPPERSRPRPPNGRLRYQASRGGSSGTVGTSMRPATMSAFKLSSCGTRWLMNPPLVA
jgi:hypothetical protein